MKGEHLKVKFFGILTFDIQKLRYCLGFANEDEVRKYFFDGRKLSFLLEVRLAKELNAKLAHSNAGYDIIVNSGELKGKWEVRTLTDELRLSPSKNIGYGRATDKNSLDKKLSEINGYIIGDAYSFPSVPVFIMYSADLREYVERNTNSEGKLGSEILTKNYTIKRSKFWEKLVFPGLSEKEIVTIISTLLEYNYNNAEKIMGYLTKEDILSLAKKLGVESLKSSMKKNGLIEAFLNEIRTQNRH